MNTNNVKLKLTEIWKQILELDEIEPEDNFFLLGGDSMLGSIMISYVNSNFNKEFTLTEIIEYPTIKSMAEYIGDT